MKLNVLVCVGSIALTAVATAMSGSHVSEHNRSIAASEHKANVSGGMFKAQAEPTCTPSPTPVD